MRIIYSFLILFIFIISNNIISPNTSSDKKEYIFSDFSNFICDKINYISSFTAKTCSESIITSDQKFTFSFQDTNSVFHKVICTIYSNSKMRFLQQTDISEITEMPVFPSKDICYKTICEFDEKIINNFTIEINTDFELKVEGLPKNIYLTNYYYENLTYNVDKCILVKNDFKQVSKYRINNSTNKITFLLVTSINSRVEKNEKISAEILLQKNNSNEYRNITCSSQYGADGPNNNNEEILMFYDCEIPNVHNISEYDGLIFHYSPYVDNIPTDSDKINPKKTDELIKKEAIKDYSVIIFESKSLDLTDCEKTGKFKLTGKINGMLQDVFEAYIPYFLNNNETVSLIAECTIPKGYREEITISCTVMNNFYNSKIKIPNLKLIDEDKDEIILQISKISINEQKTCIVNPIESTVVTPITTIIPTIKPTTYKIATDIVIEPIETDKKTEEIPTVIKNVVFRQINNLEINKGRNYIKFNIVGFTFENNLKYNMILPIKVNLVKNNGEKEPIDLECSLNDFFNSNTENIYSLTFTCIKDNINGISNYKDAIIISSSSLINIPAQFSYLSSALNTDKLISEGSLKNFLSKGNLVVISPIISSVSISADNCRTKGVFEINGIIDKSIDSDLTFYIKLENQDTSVRCKMNAVEANYRVFIYCDTYENIYNIDISSKIIYDINNNELFFLNESLSLNNIYCANNDQIKFKKAQRKMKSFASFRQVSKFRKINNRYTFFLATFIKQEIDFNQKVYLIVEIKSSSLQKIKSYIRGCTLYFRKLFPTEEQIATCTLDSKTKLNSDGIGAAGWVCTTGESSIQDAEGLVVIKSDDVSGIPKEPQLIDPAKTDNLIQSGEIKDYSIEENLNILIPLFKTLNLNYSMCKKNGSLSFIGTSTSTIEKDVLFNLTLSYPDAIFACKLPRVLKDQITQIECYSREEFENYTLLVEETVIRYEGQEYFILRNTSSGDSYVTCSSTDSNMAANTYNEDFKIVSRIYKDGSSGGLSVAGIVIIVIIGVLVLAGLTILFIYIKSKKVNKNENDENENELDTTTDNGHFKTDSSFY